MPIRVSLPSACSPPCLRVDPSTMIERDRCCTNSYKIESFFLGLGVMALLQPVPRTKLGSQGLEVSRLGLGCIGMSSFYGPARPEEEMVELIRYAVEQSDVTLLDTSDTSGPFTNEVLIGKVNNTYRSKSISNSDEHVIMHTKIG